MENVFWRIEPVENGHVFRSILVFYRVFSVELGVSSHLQRKMIPVGSDESSSEIGTEIVAIFPSNSI